MRTMPGIDDGGARPHEHATIRVADVMTRDMVVMPSWFTAVNARCGPARHAAYPVVDAAGAPVGVVGPEVLGDAELRGQTFGEVCRPLSSLPVVRPEDNIDRLIDLPELPDCVGALVVQENRLVGMVSRGYLMRLNRARAELSLSA